MIRPCDSITQTAQSPASFSTQGAARTAWQKMSCSAVTGRNKAMVWWPGTVLDEQEQAGGAVAGIQSLCHSRLPHRLVTNELLQAVAAGTVSTVLSPWSSRASASTTAVRKEHPKPALPEGTHSPRLQVQQSHAPTPKNTVGGRSVTTE